MKASELLAFIDSLEMDPRSKLDTIREAVEVMAQAEKPKGKPAAKPGDEG